MSKDLQYFVENLNYAEKVERSLNILEQAYDKFCDKLVIANSLGKDSIVLWDLACEVIGRPIGIIITTRHKPKETKQFMEEETAVFPELKVYENKATIPEDLYKTDPDECCRLLKVEPLRRAFKELDTKCWASGIRCTEGHTRTDFQEVEQWRGIEKINPLLLWHEREIWQYTAINNLPVNPLYEKGYRSLGCEPCTSIASGSERAGRWLGTSKCGGECGIHKGV